MAQRSSVSVVVYVYTRTSAQLAADVGAWLASWSVPAMVLTGARKGAPGTTATPGRPGRGVSEGIPQRFSWLRQRRDRYGRAVRSNFYDIDAMVDDPVRRAELQGAMTGSFARGRPRTVPKRPR